ncbi:MAG: glycosyltransferase [Spirochaetia bacterium]|nr:glycosyltransferase [Spirochaetia bacterium]
MIELINVKKGPSLEDYELHPSCSLMVSDLRKEASMFMPLLKGRKIWMINSTARGGGVAEMLPRQISLFRQLGLKIDWLVMSTEKKEFFILTKRIHNLIHGVGKGYFSTIDKNLYESVSKENVQYLLKYIRPKDIVVIHDPQPMAMGAFLKQKIDVTLIWRCHIGNDEKSKKTDACWKFLKPYADFYDYGVFSFYDYIPEYFKKNSRIIYPAIDPYSHKNRELHLHKITGILSNAKIVRLKKDVLTAPFNESVKRLQPDGSFGACYKPENIGVLFRPILLQVSRWDKLKGFLPLMKAFIHLKAQGVIQEKISKNQKRRLELLRLVLAGPDPISIQDDPEALEVIKEISSFYCSQNSELQKDIAVLLLPMTSEKENALVVNALQKSSSIVVQNSLKEGFGLTVTEAMWKGIPVIGSNARGIRHQIRNHIDGIIIDNPEDTQLLASAISDLLADPMQRKIYARNTQNHVIQEFLIFGQLKKWLRVLSTESIRRNT